ncbi:hypothetical protein O5O45_15245 [Hahella aquimaris]|uniref:hypothetical protein n=1 Tax=Hahella sp. HNIBRBA332 TaxID=3015983 RepID=UPI00273AC930|nr:hypothetical protein [Hahella sp. HNIBRBA332]WLQ17275.1 hypothetical protein O5O45_15245 [Hahella sp. HNIBRBA332]
MFEFFKRIRTSKQPEKKSEAEHIDTRSSEQPVWFEVGEDNPFDAPVLDIRCITLKVIATTADKSIAENYVASRTDDGRRYIDQEIAGSEEIPCDIHYHHGGETLEGVVSKAESMDVKWDIYAYGEWIYFVRSWTSVLMYKVHYQNTGSELILDRIVAADIDDPNLLRQNIHSMIMTHALNSPWPYTIPASLKSASESDIALALFSKFGCKATLATFANSMDIHLVGK